jgi:hypothetical protein
VNEPILIPNRYSQLINLEDPTAIVNAADLQTELINVEANRGQYISTILNTN